MRTRIFSDFNNRKLAADRRKLANQTVGPNTPVADESKSSYYLQGVTTMVKPLPVLPRFATATTSTKTDFTFRPGAVQQSFGPNSQISKQKPATADQNNAGIHKHSEASYARIAESLQSSLENVRQEVSMLRQNRESSNSYRTNKSSRQQDHTQRSRSRNSFSNNGSAYVYTPQAQTSKNWDHKFADSASLSQSRIEPHTTIRDTMHKSNNEGGRFRTELSDFLDEVKTTADGEVYRIRVSEECVPQNQNKQIGKLCNNCSKSRMLEQKIERLSRELRQRDTQLLQKDEQFQRKVLQLQSKNQKLEAQKQRLDADMSVALARLDQMTKSYLTLAQCLGETCVSVPQIKQQAELVNQQPIKYSRSLKVHGQAEQSLKPTKYLGSLLKSGRMQPIPQILSVANTDTRTNSPTHITKRRQQHRLLN